jgi:hypothetical protein
VGIVLCLKFEFFEPQIVVLLVTSLGLRHLNLVLVFCLRDLLLQVFASFAPLKQLELVDYFLFFDILERKLFFVKLVNFDVVFANSLLPLLFNALQLGFLFVQGFIDLFFSALFGVNYLVP